MENRKLIGLLGISLAIPSLVVVLGLLGFAGFQLNHWLVIEKLLIVVCAILGGILLLIDRQLGLYLVFLAVMLAWISAIQRLFAFDFQLYAMSAGSIIQTIYELIIGSIIVICGRNRREAP